LHYLLNKRKNKMFYQVKRAFAYVALTFDELNLSHYENRIEEAKLGIFSWNPRSGESMSAYSSFSGEDEGVVRLRYLESMRDGIERNIKRRTKKYNL
jgi:hypothetical protein